MKKLQLIFPAILILAMATHSFAQVKNAIKIPIVGLFAGQYQLAYERTLAENVSINLSGGYINRSFNETWGSDSYGATTSGFLVVPEFRFYFKEAIKGMYLAAFFRYKTTMQDLDDTSNPRNTDVSRELTVTSLGGGLTFGWQFLISEKLVIDMYIGPIWKNATKKTSYRYPGVTDADFDAKFFDFKITDNSPIGLRGGVSFGFGF